MNNSKKEIWLASGLRTPFVKENKELESIGAVDLSVAVLNQMKRKEQLNPDYVAWGTVVPNLEYSNIARDAVLESEVNDETIAFTTTMACSTSLLSTLQLASMLKDTEVGIAGGVESMSNVQMGLSNKTSKWIKRFPKLKGFFNKLKWLGGLFKFKLYIPPGVNRVTGKSMGQHAEITAQRLNIDREAQDKLALRSHQNYFKAKEKGFFEDLVFPAFNVLEDLIPRKNTSLEKLGTLKPVFDRKSGNGTLTAGNSTLFTDGAAGVWVAGKDRIDELKTGYKAQLVDWEMAGVNIEEEGILMSPSFAIPRLLERNNLTYDDVDLWEIHEAFASQVLSTISNLENKTHLKKVGTASEMGKFPIEKLNPNGSSIAIGHPFGATGARILSQTIKELHQMGKGKKALVSVCADGGLGAVALIEN
ncbi:thiolase family protein [Maribacter flavus]|uniref:Acetyl-CoA C-acyltransferase n=1 Tax=Maribacter flavus TaxID=1658664 RepID=A0A5B2TTP3_9FLAO|nr:acetyl-CoA C-acyltransferase [Maribacter flavus]KAA2217398.1 acetyl-CoA C-acyltransferase [Maribacter flavus]